MKERNHGVVRSIRLLTLAKGHLMRFVPYSFSYTHVEYYTEGIAIFWQMAFTLGLYRSRVKDGKVMEYCRTLKVHYEPCYEPKFVVASH